MEVSAAEFLDLSYPVRLRRYAINCDSGGPGRWRGGCGVIREIASRQSAGEGAV